LLWNNALPYGLREGAAEQGITTLHWPRNPLCSAISKDGGETWGSIRFVENRTGYNNGYPSATFLDDEVFVTWYSCSESTDWSAEVMLKIFSKGWFYGEGT
jgi:hypothetical protein